LDLALERAALVALLHPPQEFKWAPLRDMLLEEELLPSAAFEQRVKSGHFADPTDALDLALQRIKRWEEDGTRFLTFLDPEYPRQLRDVHDLPPFVFARGALTPVGQTERGISIVGSRDASPEALRDAALLAGALVQLSVPVVSGLAAGIDSAAHRAALDASGRTIGIIGTGIDRYYPKTSESMQREIAEGAGLVLSQFWPGTGPTRYNFPMRNGVMSAFSCATVIVEATEKSGTKHQAQRAIAHGRPLILSAAVARDTTWGRKLASDPTRLDVSVVSSVDEAVEVAAAKAVRPYAVPPENAKEAVAW
jgi:DNA processing protein